MRVPVFITLPTNQYLVTSATDAFLQAELLGASPFRSPLDNIVVPEGIELNLRAPAMPLGSGQLDNLPLDGFHPERSAVFLLEAFIDVPNFHQVPPSIGGVPIFSNPRIARFETCTEDAPIGGWDDVVRQLNSSKLAGQSLDGTNVAIAIVDDGVGQDYVARKLLSAKFDFGNSWSYQAQGIVAGAQSSEHGDARAFDAVLCAPKATLLDCPALRVKGDPGTSRTESLLSGPKRVFSWLLQKWAVTPDSLSRYNGLVVNNSWGVPNPSWDFDPTHPGNYVSNPQHPFNIIAAKLAIAGVDLVFAAGNCGSGCPGSECAVPPAPSIMGANALPGVLTIGAVSVNQQWLSYSSEGPSIANMFPQKPDVSAYSHFLGANVGSTGSPDVGTSAACAVGAGCVAALRTKWKSTMLSPSDLFSALRANAVKAVAAAGWDPSYGYGIIDPLATAASLSSSLHPALRTASRRGGLTARLK